VRYDEEGFQILIGTAQVRGTAFTAEILEEHEELFFSLRDKRNPLYDFLFKPAEIEVAPHEFKIGVTDGEKP
jgi:hypothetical protein